MNHNEDNFKEAFEKIFYSKEILSTAELKTIIEDIPLKVIRWLAAEHWDNRTRKRLLRLSNVYIEENVFLNALHIWIMDSWERRVAIGPRAGIGANCTIVADSAPHSTILARSTSKQTINRPVIIGADVWLGVNVTLLPGVTIGDGSVIGAGSVVTRSIPRCSIAAGIPAKVIKIVENPDIPNWIDDNRQKIEDWMSGKIETPLNFDD